MWLVPVLTLACLSAPAHAVADAGRVARIIGPRPAPAESQPSLPTPAEPPAAPALTNDAGLTLDMSPSPRIPLGARLTFKVGARKKGYVLLVDVDSSGRLTQIFPNFLSAAKTQGRSAPVNEVAKGALAIPPPNAKEYEFVAAPPIGVGMVVAIFSETRLDVIDLPDVPAALVGQPDAATFIGDAARALRIMPTENDREFREPKFSFVAKFYVIR